MDQTIPMERVSFAEMEKSFRRHVEKWRKDTQYCSSMTEIILHPSYQRIIGTGPSALPLILKELQERPGHWFWALEAIADESPVESDSSFKEAVLAWLKWGRDRKYL